MEVRESYRIKIKDHVLLQVLFVGRNMSEGHAHNLLIHAISKRQHPSELVPLMGSESG